MKEEVLIKDAFDSIVDCNEMKAMETFKVADNTGIDLIDLMTYGYNAGVEYLGELFYRGEIVLPKLIDATRIFKAVMKELDRKMAMAEIKCAGVDYCFFRETGALNSKKIK